MSEWQPIETAPRDGTKVDLKMSSGRVAENVFWADGNDVYGWVDLALNYVRGEDEAVYFWRPSSPI